MCHQATIQYQQQIVGQPFGDVGGLGGAQAGAVVLGTGFRPRPSFRAIPVCRSIIRRGRKKSPRLRMRWPPRHQGRMARAVAAVAGEQFVAALAGRRDFHILARAAGKKPGRMIA